MPHLTLEITPNVTANRASAELFRALHAILVDTGGIALGNFKHPAGTLSAPPF